MVAVFNKDLMNWYLATLKATENVEAVDSAESVDHPGQSEGQQLESESAATVSEEEKQINLQADSQWIISIKEKLEQVRQNEVVNSLARLSIYRVPDFLRRGDDKSFVPQIVSLGPYHHGKPHLQNMESHKWRSLYKILSRTNHDIQPYLDSIARSVERIRCCYDGRTLDFNSDTLVEMMVLDGCFLLELFQGIAKGFESLGYPENDPIFAMNYLMHSIQRDAIMLENQLPLFVLERLLELQLGVSYRKGLVEELTVIFFATLTPNDEQTRSSISNQSQLYKPRTNVHCLDVFRRTLLLGDETLSYRNSRRMWLYENHAGYKLRHQSIHCVKELIEAGIKFQKGKTNQFWDIEFNNGVLEIPRLLIHDGVRSLFLNLIAFEQCHHDCSNDITSYVVFMDNLINSHEDVAYLRRRGIIEHWLGSDAEVAELFNRLCQEVVYDVDNSYLLELSLDLNSYYNRRWNTWRAILKKNYFSNPWAVISFIAAASLLLFTFMQTFYGVYGFYHR